MRQVNERSFINSSPGERPCLRNRHCPDRSHSSPAPRGGPAAASRAASARPAPPSIAPGAASQAAVALQPPRNHRRDRGMVTAAGGTGIAVRVDHTVELEVEALFARVAARPRPPRRARQQHRRRGPAARRLGTLLADRFHPRRRRPAPVDPLAPHHRQACGAAHDQTTPRSHRRGHRGRHGVWRRRQRALRRREELAQGLCGAHGGRAAHASRRGRLDYAGVPAIRVDARSTSASRKPTGATPAKRTRTSSSPSRRCLLAGRSRRSRPTRRSSSAPATSSARGNWRATTASLTTMAAGPTGACISARSLPAIGFVEPFRRHRAFLERMIANGRIELPRGG